MGCGVRGQTQCADRPPPLAAAASGTTPWPGRGPGVGLGVAERAAAASQADGAVGLAGPTSRGRISPRTPRGLFFVWLAVAYCIPPLGSWF
jgi:hypothetical protein